MVLDVFEAHAQALCFPEVDHPTLDADAQALREAAAEVQRCEQALGEARHRLDERKQALLARATRGLAYARIYAQDDASLSEALAEIDLSPRKASRGKRAKAPRRTTRAKRGRSPEKDESITELPFAPDAPAEATADVA